MKKWVKSRKLHRSSSVRCTNALRAVLRLMLCFVAKALELFLALIVDEASKVTVERGSKKVEPYHLYVQRSRSVDDYTP